MYMYVVPMERTWKYNSNNTKKMYSTSPQTTYEYFKNKTTNYMYKLKFCGTNNS